jgi:hypothetical protein
VAALALLVLAEKLAPGGPVLACIAGLGLEHPAAVPMNGSARFRQGALC